MQPRRVIASPEWSGIDAEDRAYAAFTINVEREKPWHTLSGRMHLYLDHAWMRELGEALPAYRPPLDPRLMLAGGVEVASDGVPEITLRYLTPHSKWSIHSEYQDNLHMLTLFRGGSGFLDEPAGRRGDRRARQRVDRGLQPSRDGGLPRGRLAPRAARRVPDVPLQGPPAQHARARRSTGAAAGPRTRSRRSR